MGQEDKLPVDTLFSVAPLNRIAEALLPLRAVHNRTRYLTALNSGNLDLLQRKKSHAKNVLWGLELCSILKRRNFDTFLEEPPDIVVSFGDSKIGIACKKLENCKWVTLATSAEQRTSSATQTNKIQESKAPIARLQGLTPLGLTPCLLN